MPFRRTLFNVMLISITKTKTVQWPQTIPTAKYFPSNKKCLLLTISLSHQRVSRTNNPQARQVAYEMAELNQFSMLPTWEEKKLAGTDWLNGFLKRNPTLSLRTPEATSFARATAFNKHLVNKLLNLLEGLTLKLKVTGERIFNLDETGLTTVQKILKVICAKGMKQVGQVTSRERGELMTVFEIVSATGVALPPAIVFPRKNYKDIFLTGAPEVSKGLATESGWMNSELFKEVIKHLVKLTHSTKEDPIIIIFNYHESQLSLPALAYAKDNGVHIITLPLHSSQKTKPLDRTVYGPLKAFFNDEAISWMMQNPRKTKTIYQIRHWCRLA